MNKVLEVYAQREKEYKESKEVNTFRSWFYSHFSASCMEVKVHDMQRFCSKEWRAWYNDLVANNGIRKYANFDSFVISDIEKELSEYQF